MAPGGQPGGDMGGWLGSSSRWEPGARSAGSQACGLRLCLTLPPAGVAGRGQPLTPDSECLSPRQLNSPNPPDVNCADQLGNTPLHCAAYRAQRHCVLALLKSGADPNLRNRNGEQALGREAVRASVPWESHRALALRASRALHWACSSLAGGQHCFWCEGRFCERNPTALCPEEPCLRRLWVERNHGAGAFSCDVSAE